MTYISCLSFASLHNDDLYIWPHKITSERHPKIWVLWRNCTPNLNFYNLSLDKSTSCTQRRTAACSLNTQYIVFHVSNIVAKFEDSMTNCSLRSLCAWAYWSIATTYDHKLTWPVTLSHKISISLSISATFHSSVMTGMQHKTDGYNA